jgi:hypothetical protein
MPQPRLIALLTMILALLGLAVPAQARWLRAESPRFIVYSDGEAVAINLDIEPVEKPESVAWVDAVHPKRPGTD